VVMGFVNMAEFIKLADIFCMPNYSEGLGTPMLESLACGVPVVANDEEPAFRQWINNDTNGYLAALNIDQWKEAVSKASKFDEHKRIKASKNILKMAGSRALDEYFYRMIKSLSSTEEGQEYSLPEKGFHD